MYRTNKPQNHTYKTCDKELRYNSKLLHNFQTMKKSKKASKDYRICSKRK